MIGFQMFTLLVLLMFVTSFIFLLKRKRGAISSAAILMVLGVIVLIVVVLVDPLSSQRVAEWCGIGRGADLVIYLAILFLLFSSFTSYLRSRRTYSKMAEIARKVALLDVQYPKHKKSED